MIYQKFAIATISACLLSTSVYAAVNTGTTVSATGSVVFGAASITSNTIVDAPDLPAGTRSGNTLVGTGTVITDSSSLVAFQPLPALKDTTTSAPQRYLRVPGTANPNNMIQLVISKEANNDSAGQTDGDWTFFPGTPSTSTTYYILLTPSQNVVADSYNYTINAATYSL